MKEREILIKLYDIYKNLLTEKQREYFENYYFEDYSLSEISALFNVSKTLVGKTLKSVEKKLINFEMNLKIYELNEKLKEILNKVTNKNIKSELESLIK